VLETAGVARAGENSKSQSKYRFSIFSSHLGKKVFFPSTRCIFACASDSSDRSAEQARTQPATHSHGHLGKRRDSKSSWRPEMSLMSHEDGEKVVTMGACMRMCHVPREVSAPPPGNSVLYWSVCCQWPQTQLWFLGVTLLA
jgi:hypothetical protein